ncbi:hypothetical protein ES707_05388 [subsurface metagenome]
MNAFGSIVFIFDCYLIFSVGSQPGEFFTLAHFFQPSCNSMCKLDWHRHKLWCFAAGIAEHQSLVTGALFLVQAGTLCYTLRDIRTLFSD